MKKVVMLIRQETLYQNNLNQMAHAVPLHSFRSLNFALCNEISSFLSGTG